MYRIHGVAGASCKSCLRKVWTNRLNNCFQRDIELTKDKCEEVHVSSKCSRRNSRCEFLDEEVTNRNINVFYVHLLGAIFYCNIISVFFSLQIFASDWKWKSVFWPTFSNSKFYFYCYNHLCFVLIYDFYKCIWWSFIWKVLRESTVYKVYKVQVHSLMHKWKLKVAWTLKC